MSKDINFEWINSQHGLFPASPVYRLLILCFFLHLRKRDMHDRSVQHMITNGMPSEKGSPMDAGMPFWNLGIDGSGCVLKQPDILKVKREADQMEIQPTNCDRVAVEMAMHFSFCVRAKRLIDKRQRKAGYHGQYD
jgi:hypothetical protein